ncbi:excalibur calcium-binding domain-containing protein [Nocardia colli]|uniref:Excalibur calcium-binding domain-containing protein n=1 Tax=Nocardia colli TaxID=2545717 RepID=A0A5N0DU52_9NOCA|nr:excalibur calcium-binding domain-containing protein [Nocardia colli]KAA8880608.1 excalibur calcium-binding domain-containing protein [Nocardia colli]
MKVRKLIVLAGIGLTFLAAPAALAEPITGSSGTGSSVVDAGSAAIGSAGLNQTGSAGGAFDNCDQARAAHRAPLFRGEPGYSPLLDPGDSGMACPTV